ncbi:hypothetical protein MRX96_007546 [Rhipicephalus microplus]
MTAERIHACRGRAAEADALCVERCWAADALGASRGYAFVSVPNRLKEFALRWYVACGVRMRRRSSALEGFSLPASHFIFFITSSSNARDFKIHVTWLTSHFRFVSLLAHRQPSLASMLSRRDGCRLNASQRHTGETASRSLRGDWPLHLPGDEAGGRGVLLLTPMLTVRAPKAKGTLVIAPGRPVRSVKDVLIECVKFDQHQVICCSWRDVLE